jgi:hypothetical protein
MHAAVQKFTILTIGVCDRLATGDKAAAGAFGYRH